MTFGEMVAQLAGWLGDFVQWLVSFCPRYKVLQYNERGVKYVRGERPTQCGPGTVWYWPWCTKVHPYWTSRCLLLVDSVAVETEDGVPIEIGVVVTYRIIDFVKFDCDNTNSDENMGEAAQAVVREMAQGNTYLKLNQPLHEDSRLAQKYSSRMADALEEFGVEVLSCRPTHQVRLGYVVRLFGALASKPQETMP